MGINRSKHCLEATEYIEMSENITPREYFDVFIKTRCFCESGNCGLDHYNAYQPNNTVNREVYLPSNTPYSIGICNYHDHPILARITIDTIYLGKVHVHPYTTINVKRPISVDKELVFVNKCSELSKLPSLAHWNIEALGTIQIDILPSKLSQDTVSFPPYDLCDNDVSYNNAFNMRHTAPAQVFGGTVLGGSTSQTFRKAPFLQTKGQHRYIIRLRNGNPAANRLYFTEKNPSTHVNYTVSDNQPVDSRNNIVETAV